MSSRKILGVIRNDNSPMSWIITVILAFVVVKFLLFPGLGFLLSTSHPVVAVVSNSMHHGGNLDQWWDQQGGWYERNGINKSNAEQWPLKNGFDKGDIIILKGSPSYQNGDTIVFIGKSKNPIIHRVVKVTQEGNRYIYQTKGDNNPDSHESIGELSIPQEKVIGKSIIKIPYLGWLKLLASEGLNLTKGG